MDTKTTTLKLDGKVSWPDAYVRPAIKASKANPKDDAISSFIEDGYSNVAIIIECLTYGSAGMLTTREFITMTSWYLFENQPLRERFFAT